jgi:hypothetical protein
MSAAIMGVANTRRLPLPTCFAVCSSVTGITADAFVPMVIDFMVTSKTAMG